MILKENSYYLKFTTLGKDMLVFAQGFERTLLLKGKENVNGNPLLWAPQTQQTFTF